MLSDERNSIASPEAEKQDHDQEIVVFPRDSDGRVSLKSIRGGGLSKAERIRGVTRSLAVDALALLNEMQEDCQKSPELLEKYFQLYHCLSYLKRFCDGKA